MQRSKQIATIQQNMEGKQQAIERQLKGEAERLARVESDMTDSARQFVKVERRLQDRDQQLVTYERESEKRLGDVERKQLEEKHEVGKRVAEVDKKLEEAMIQFKEGCNQTVIELADLNERLEQMESSVGKEQDKVKEKLEANENRLDGVERKQQEERLEINRQLAEFDEKVEEKGEEQVETSLAEHQGQAIAANGKEEKLEEQLATFIPPFDIVMTDFEQHKKDGDSWCSPPFCSHTGGYKMCLRVCAKGRGRGEGTHVSVSVHLMCGAHDDYLKWPFHGYIIVKMLNQRREEKHILGLLIHFNDSSGYEATARVVGHERAMVGSGCSTFIAHSALGYNSAKNTEYLRNDCLKFRVTKIKLTNL